LCRNVCDVQHKIIEPCCGASEDISGAPPRLGARLPLRGVARTYSSSRMARRLGDPIYPTTSAARLAASFRVSASRAHRVHEKRLAVQAWRCATSSLSRHCPGFIRRPRRGEDAARLVAGEEVRRRVLAGLGLLSRTYARAEANKPSAGSRLRNLLVPVPYRSLFSAPQRCRTSRICRPGGSSFCPRPEFR
jgi:hypothetical protein